MPVSVPTFIKQAWAAVGTKFTIPDNANPTTGRAGWDQGFSPINLTPVAAGGIPPFGQDMNGVLYDITSAIQYIQAGRSFPYNQDFADAIGGYGKGSLVSLDSDLSVVYESKVDNNLSPPPSANWEVSGAVAQATESVAGIAKVATQSVANSLSSNTDFITPAKLPGAVKSVFSASGNTPVFACRAFVSFDGVANPPSIRYSGNVSSITDNGAGNYNINFQTEMPDVNYTVNVSSNAGNCFANRTAPATQTYFAPTTSSCRVIVNEGTGSGGVDANSVNVIIFR